jgi:uncharacterized protein
MVARRTEMDAYGLLILIGIAVASFALSFYGAAFGLILGHLRLPLLIYYLPSTAAGMAVNLAVSGMGALTGAVRHARAGRVSVQLIAMMGVPSVIGAVLGAVFLVKIDAAWARLVIGGFLLISGLNLILTKAVAGGSVPVLRKLRLFTEAVVGLLIGFLAAVTGLMLGSIRLPVMIRMFKVDPAVAVGSNMAIGCLTAFAGAGSLWPRGEGFPLLPLLIIAPPTILGGYLGARYTGRFRKETLQRLVGATIALTGIGMALEGVKHVFLS